jgi:hypothetical protein
MDRVVERYSDPHPNLCLNPVILNVNRSNPALVERG